MNLLYLQQTQKAASMNIIWPYDPFLRDIKLDKIGNDLLKNFFANDKLELVYVASKSEIQLSYSYNIPDKYRFSLYPKNLIKKQLMKLNINHAKIKIIESGNLSTTKMASELAIYAKEKKADLVLLPTNSKKTIPKFIFGSFAESFLHLSKTDTLVYHQKNSYLNQKPKKILYAHDFSAMGKKGLLKAVNYAKKWDAKLIVLHIPIPLMGQTDEEFSFLEENNLNKCEQMLTKMNIKFEVLNLLNDFMNDESTIAEIILKFAVKHKADLLAMTTQASKLEKILGGSICRQVLRESSKPVLIFKT